MYTRATYIGINSVWCHTVKYATRLSGCCVWVSLTRLWVGVIFQVPWLARSRVGIEESLYDHDSPYSKYRICWGVFLHRTNTSAQDGWTTSTSRLTHTDNVPEQQGRETHTEQSSGVLDSTTSYAIYSYISSSSIHAVCIPVPDEARLGRNCSRTVIKFEQLHLWWHVTLLETTTL